MTIESASDRTVFVDPDDFGIAATIGSNTLNGIFDTEYVERGEMSGYEPVFNCVTSEYEAVGSIGSTIVIGGVSYTIREDQPDGTGMTMLRLEA